MKDIMRKHLWPAALVAALAVVGMLAAFVVLTGPQRGTAEAQSLCASASGSTLQAFIQAGVCSADTMPSPSPSTGGGSPDPATPGQPGAPTPTPTPAGDSLCASATGDRLAALIASGICQAPTATGPVAVNEINDVSLLERSEDTMRLSNIFTAAIDVSDNFSDGDTLTYTARSSNTARATVAVAGSRVTVTGVAPGLATITVTGTDASSRTATQSFRVTVLNDDLPSVPRLARAYPLDNAITLRWSTPIFDGAPDNAVITGYRITRTVSSDSPLKGKGGDKVINVDASTLMYRDQGLSYNEFYTYQVQAVNRYGAGVYSAPLTYRTAESGGRIEPETSAPSPPRDVRLRPACDDMITVTWREPSDPGLVRKPGPGSYVGPDYEGGRGAGVEIQGTAAVIDHYRVERQVNGGNWSVVADEVAASPYVDSSANLSYGSTYAYRVTARNNVPLYSEPAVGDPVTLTQPETPAPPTSLVAVDVSSTYDERPAAFELQWDAPVGDWRTADDIGAGFESISLSYRIDRRHKPTGEPWGQWEPIQDALPHQYSTDGLGTRLTQEYTDLNPPVGVAINYRVAAQYDRCVQSDWNQADEVQISIFSQPLGAPTDLTATAGAATGGTGGTPDPIAPGAPGGAGAAGSTVTLRWTAGANSQMHWVAGIRQTELNAGDYSNVIWTQAGSNTTHTVTGLDSAALYVFTVAAGRQAPGQAAEWSGWAPLVQVTTN